LKTGGQDLRGRAGANINQLGSDFHFLTAPFRFLWGMLMWAIVLLLSPLLLIATLVFGVRLPARNRSETHLGG
jgi:hypothetical protein